jgi:hypothetical protein
MFFKKKSSMTKKLKYLFIILGAVVVVGWSFSFTHGILIKNEMDIYFAQKTGPVSKKDVLQFKLEYKANHVYLLENIEIFRNLLSFILILNLAYFIKITNSKECRNNPDGVSTAHSDN